MDVHPRPTPPPLSTQINTLAYSPKIRWQIQCPKITREKNDTPSDLTAPDSIASDLPAQPSPADFSDCGPWLSHKRGQDGAMFKECNRELKMDWLMLCNVRRCWLMSASQVSYSLFLFSLCFLRNNQVELYKYIYFNWLLLFSKPIWNTYLFFCTFFVCFCL